MIQLVHFIERLSAWAGKSFGWCIVILTLAVSYEVFVEDRATSRIERIVELHRMKYFFVPELEAALTEAGLSLLGTRAGLAAAELHPRAWHGLVLARAN